MTRPEDSHAAETLAYALENHPRQVEIIDARQLLMDSARKNPKRPAYVQLAVPDEVVKGLRGRRDDGDLVLLVRIPQEVRERQGSNIILPGELG